MRGTCTRSTKPKRAVFRDNRIQCIYHVLHVYKRWPLTSSGVVCCIDLVIRMIVYCRNGLFSNFLIFKLSHYGLRNTPWHLGFLGYCFGRNLQLSADIRWGKLSTDHVLIIWRCGCLLSLTLPLTRVLVQSFFSPIESCGPKFHDK